MLAKHALSQLSYSPNWRSADGEQRMWVGTGSATATIRHSPLPIRPADLVGLGRLERPTSPLSGVRSNHLSYRPKLIKDTPERCTDHAIRKMRKRNEDGVIPPNGT